MQSTHLFIQQPVEGSLVQCERREDSVTTVGDWDQGTPGLTSESSVRSCTMRFDSGSGSMWEVGRWLL